MRPVAPRAVGAVGVGRQVREGEGAERALEVGPEVARAKVDAEVRRAHDAVLRRVLDGRVRKVGLRHCENVIVHLRPTQGRLWRRGHALDPLGRDLGYLFERRRHSQRWA